MPPSHFVPAYPSPSPYTLDIFESFEGKMVKAHYALVTRPDSNIMQAWWQHLRNLSGETLI